MQKNKHIISGVIVKIEEQIIMKDNTALKNLYIELDNKILCLLKEQDYNIFTIGDRVKFIGAGNKEYFNVSAYNNITKNKNSINKKLTTSIILFLILLFILLIFGITIGETSKYSDAYSFTWFGFILFLVITLLYARGIILLFKNKKWLLEDDFKDK